MTTHKMGQPPNRVEADPARSQRASPASVPQSEPLPAQPGAIDMTLPAAVIVRCPDCGIELVDGAKHSDDCPAFHGALVEVDTIQDGGSINR